jgi:hypothetical protein
VADRTRRLAAPIAAEHQALGELVDRPTILVDIHDSENPVRLVNKCKFRFLAFNRVQVSTVRFEILKRTGHLLISTGIRGVPEFRENVDNEFNSRIILDSETPSLFVPTIFHAPLLVKQADPITESYDAGQDCRGWADGHN